MCVYPVHTHKQIVFCIIYLLCIIYYCVSYTGILHSVIIRYTSSSIFLYAIKCSEIFEPFFSLHLSVHFSVCVFAFMEYARYCSSMLLQFTNMSLCDHILYKPSRLCTRECTCSVRLCNFICASNLCVLNVCAITKNAKINRVQLFSLIFKLIFK